MKDWKAEYDKLRGEISELRKLLEYERAERRRREDHEDRFRNTFKQLLLDTLSD